jgi:hypothetical protein
MKSPTTANLRTADGRLTFTDIMAAELVALSSDSRDDVSLPGGARSSPQTARAQHKRAGDGCSVSGCCKHIDKHELKSTFEGTRCTNLDI